MGFLVPPPPPQLYCASLSYSFVRLFLSLPCLVYSAPIVESYYDAGVAPAFTVPFSSRLQRRVLPLSLMSRVDEKKIMDIPSPTT